MSVPWARANATSGASAGVTATVTASSATSTTVAPSATARVGITFGVGQRVEHGQHVDPIAHSEGEPLRSGEGSPGLGCPVAAARRPPLRPSGARRSLTTGSPGRMTAVAMRPTGGSVSAPSRTEAAGAPGARPGRPRLSRRARPARWRRRPAQPAPPIDRGLRLLQPPGHDQDPPQRRAGSPPPSARPRGDGFDTGRAATRGGGRGAARSHLQHERDWRGRPAQPTAAPVPPRWAPRRMRTPGRRAPL